MTSRGGDRTRAASPASPGSAPARRPVRRRPAVPPPAARRELPCPGPVTPWKCRALAPSSSACSPWSSSDSWAAPLAFYVAQKSLTLTVDGQAQRGRHLRRHGRRGARGGGAAARRRTTSSCPPPDASVDDGDTVVLNRARPLQLTVDGAVQRGLRDRAVGGRGARAARLPRRRPGALRQPQRAPAAGRHGADRSPRPRTSPRRRRPAARGDDDGRRPSASCSPSRASR